MTEQTNLVEIKTAVDDVSAMMREKANAWNAYMESNDQRLADIEKGKGTAEVEEKLQKMSNAIDHINDCVNRPLQTPEIKAAESKEELNKLVNKWAHSRKGGDLGEFFHQNQAEFKALSVNSDPDGGYLVMPEFGGMINGRVFETSPVRQLATVETISTDAYELVNDDDEAGATWTGETTAISETSTPQLNMIRIPTHEIAAEPKATNKLLEDAAVNMEPWLLEKVADQFRRTENTAFVSGNGVGKPRGITTYDAWAAAGTYEFGKVEQANSGGATSITSAGLINFRYALKEEYESNATFCMSRSTASAVRQLTEPGAGASGYLWQPNFQAGEPDTLLGFPTSQWNDLAGVTSGTATFDANALPMVFGDIRRAYTIVDRIGFTMLRDPYTGKPYVKFYCRKRVGGAVMNFDAVKLLKIST